MARTSIYSPRSASPRQYRCVDGGEVHPGSCSTGKPPGPLPALSLAFYDRDALPAEYRGDALVALHAPHSRPERTGYKVIRVRMNDGQPTGEYENFMTGFVVDNDTVWGRAAGVAVTQDGALLVSDDANGTIFRVTRR